MCCIYFNHPAKNKTNVLQQKVYFIIKLSYNYAFLNIYLSLQV